MKSSLSQDVQKYIHHEFIKKIKIEPFQFSNNSEKTMKQLISLLQLADQEWMNHISNTIIIEPLQMVESMFSGTSYNYMPQEIRNLLQKSEKIGFLGQFKIKERNIKIEIIFPSSSSNQPMNTYKTLFKKMMYKIYLWLSIGSQFANKSCSNQIHIFLYMTDHIKVLPSKQGEIIDQIHANTAFTTSCAPSTDIYLFRKEEWFKVLIHESFHNLGLDFSSMSMSQTQAENKIRTLFPIHIQDTRIFESYCEVWAELLNIMFVSYFSTKNKMDIDKILDKMEKHINMEQYFSLFQCTKVLNHSQLKYSDIYQDREHKPSPNIMKRYKENTNVFAYYVLKPILLFHLNDFLEWCIANNRTILDFTKTQNNIMKYCGLFERLYNSPKYLYYMEAMSQVYMNSLQTNSSNMEHKTLRMSIVENV